MSNANEGIERRVARLTVDEWNVLAILAVGHVVVVFPDTAGAIPADVLWKNVSVREYEDQIVGLDRDAVLRLVDEKMLTEPTCDCEIYRLLKKNTVGRLYRTTEYGQRVYLSAYENFWTLLKNTFGTALRSLMAFGIEASTIDEAIAKLSTAIEGAKKSGATNTLTPDELRRQASTDQGRALFDKMIDDRRN